MSFSQITTMLLQNMWSLYKMVLLLWHFCHLKPLLCSKFPKIVPQKKFVVSLITRMPFSWKHFLVNIEVYNSSSSHPPKSAMIKFFSVANSSYFLVCAEGFLHIFSFPCRSYCCHWHTTHFAVHQLLVTHILRFDCLCSTNAKVTAHLITNYRVNERKCQCSKDHPASY
jgi:hypothetical protein